VRLRVEVGVYDGVPLSEMVDVDVGVRELEEVSVGEILADKLVDELFVDVTVGESVGVSVSVWLADEVTVKDSVGDDVGVSDKVSVAVGVNNGVPLADSVWVIDGVAVFVQEGVVVDELEGDREHVDVGEAVMEGVVDLVSVGVGVTV
jgi:hypothetical protein